MRARLEDQILRRPVSEVWAECESYFGQRDPAQLARAARDPKNKLALVFRWYLGQSSRWAIAGDADRRTDTQVWCGPAIGAFNAWTRGTFLADPAERRVVTLHRQSTVDPAILVFLDRLGDFLFVAARVANHREGTQETIWDPGGRG